MKDSISLNDALARELVRDYGSPLYVYEEEVLRHHCREIRSLLKLSSYQPCYSAKANSNPALLKIIRSEGFYADAMSPGEIALDLAAGFQPQEITFYANNISACEMQDAAAQGISMCLDSLDQLRTFAAAVPGGTAAVRINPGIGAGHDQKVITGGRSKFGVPVEQLDDLIALQQELGIHINGLCMHVGSLFFDPTVYLRASEILMQAALRFPELSYLDFGGGFGVPYQGEQRLDLAAMGTALQQEIEVFFARFGRPIQIRTEPGRYLVAECAELLGTVQARKQAYDTVWLGTDIGFNVLIRPVLYGARHEIVSHAGHEGVETVTVAGDLCESGDLLAEWVALPHLEAGDVIGVRTAGAYGYSMSSDYNGRLRPAEVLLGEDGIRLIRRRETLTDLLSSAIL